MDERQGYYRDFVVTPTDRPIEGNRFAAMAFGDVFDAARTQGSTFYPRDNHADEGDVQTMTDFIVAGESFLNPPRQY